MIPAFARACKASLRYLPRIEGVSVIKSIEFENVKVFRKARAEFSDSRLNVIVGPNGSGKTTILEALWLTVSAWRDPHLRAIKELEDSADLSNPYDEGLSDAEKDVLERLPLSYRVAYWQSTGQQAAPSVCVVTDAGKNTLVASDFGMQVRWESRPMTRAMIVKFRSVELSRPATPTAFEDAIDTDGSGLVAALSDMQIRASGVSDRIRAGLKRVIPFFESYSLEIDDQGAPLRESPAAKRPPRQAETRYALKLNTTQGKLDARQVSEGTLFVLGLLAVMHQPNPPDVLLFDDLDRGLHPAALGELVKLLREFLKERPEVQIIATTHSPYLVDHFEADEVLVTALDKDGYGAIGKLTDHPEFDRWKDKQLPGEFWASVGEKWLIENGHAE